MWSVWLAFCYGSFHSVCPLMEKDKRLMEALATWCEDLTHWKRPWWWERLKAGGEGDDRGWDGWMASPTRWTWVWVNSRSWWWTGKPGVLQSTGSQRVKHDWATELNWPEVNFVWKGVGRKHQGFPQEMACPDLSTGRLQSQAILRV